MTVSNSPLARPPALPAPTGDRDTGAEHRAGRAPMGNGRPWDWGRHIAAPLTALNKTAAHNKSP